MPHGRLPIGRIGLSATAVFAAALTATVSDTRSQQGPTSPVGQVLDVFGGTLRAQLLDGSVLEGAELVGAVLVIAVVGQTLRVRIASVEQDTRDARGEVLLYDFRLIAPNGTEESLCGPDPDGRRLGLPLAGRSDPAGILRTGNATDFELVCTAGAQGKCVRSGYAPWRRTPDGRPMIDWYNACVRMVRGDYCGDGRPFTRDGTIIDIYDRISVQRSDEDPSLSFEAAWGPDGAVCVAHTRIPDIVDLDSLGRMCPRLIGRLGPTACNENASGTFLMNRSQ
ncbi:MAG TPA: ADYC domain-containing protein [Pyrinomonadaceae bacterium]